MKNFFTLKDLKAMEPHEIIKFGALKDKDSHVNVAGTGKTLLWVAQRGFIDDLAIYVQNPYQERIWTLRAIVNWGLKIKDRNSVKKLIRCDDAMLDRYRY